jgi:hypothetical protein
MSFDEMWGQARSSAAARQHSSMRLNQLPADRGPTGEKLVADAGFLRSRAKKADTVRDDFSKVDDDAMKETKQVGDSLKGFKSGSAFSTFLARWGDQMKYVEGLLANDIVVALQSSANDYAAREHKEKARHGSEKLK